MDGPEIDQEIDQENITDYFDKFTYIIVCNSEGEFCREIIYIYIRNITRIKESLTIIDLESYPQLEKYAVKGKLLQYISTNPSIIYSLAQRQETIIPTLYQEFRELELLELLDDDTSRSLAQRLNLFLKTIRVANYDEENVMWSPENYEGNTEEIVRERNESYEDYMRRTICTHVKCQTVPMLNLIPYNEEMAQMLISMIDTLSNYFDKIYSNIGLTHYAPILRQIPNIGTKCLKVLMAYEFKCVKNDDYVDGNSQFVFNDQMIDMADHTISTKDSRENLQYYIGDYFTELDLSRSFITGSAITASIIMTGRDRHYESRETMIDLLYPKILTNFNSNDIENLKQENINLWNVMVTDEENGIMTKGNNTISFKIKLGADLDIAVDDTVSDDEYKQIVQKHFHTILRYCPYIKMKEHIKPKGDTNYIIYTDNPNYIPVFRTVEIYRSSFIKICSHHVGSVRGCYTSMWSEKPQFYLTASAILTSTTHCTPNYHYFAGRKSTPQDVIIKNMQRGINMNDGVLNNIIHEYISEKNITLSHLPFYCGENVPFSIFGAPIEYPFMQEKRNKERLRQERISNRRTERQLEKRIADGRRDREERARRERMAREAYNNSRLIVAEAEREQFLQAQNQDNNSDHTNPLGLGLGNILREHNNLQPEIITNNPTPFWWLIK